MQQHSAIRLRSLNTAALLAVACTAAAAPLAATGCEGTIGESPSSGIVINTADAGSSVMPRGPGEIAGEGGMGGGTMPGGAGGMVMIAPDAGPASPDTGGAPGGIDGGPVAMLGSPVHGLTISDVAIYQAVKVSLVKKGAPVPMPTTPLVRSRPALIRVFVTPAAGWQARPVVARLQWGTGAPRDSMITVGAASADAMLATTINFQLTAGDLMTPGVQWSVELHEALGATATGDTTGARIPADGTQAMLTTTDPGPLLKIVVVPIRSNGNLPDTSATQIKFLTDVMFAAYPVTKVDVTVRDPIDAQATVSPQGNGWDAALNQVCVTRQNDHPARNVFYYGLVNPSATFQAYCARGCVDGIAVLANNPNQDNMRCAMGTGYTGMGSGVFLQEVAHAMGRMHAPCGMPSQQDPNFPYQNGRVGVWGYDMVHQRLIDPMRTADFMSYCSPVWVSDYTFSHLLPWIQAVNKLVPTMDVSPDGTSPEVAAARAPAATAVLAPGTALGTTFRFPPARWRVATVESDGGVLWGPLVDFDEIAGAETHTVVVRDGGGGESTVSGVWIPHSHTGGGMLLVPATTPVDGNAIQIGAGTVFRNLRGVAR